MIIKPSTIYNMDCLENRERLLIQPTIPTEKQLEQLLDQHMEGRIFYTDDMKQKIKAKHGLHRQRNS